MVWDLGFGFELKTLYASGYAAVITSVAATALTWAFVLTRGSAQ
jgi:succinate dehydrogenase / fumarate reductase cytochrome b subunit